MDFVIVSDGKEMRLSLRNKRIPKSLITIGRENYKTIVILPKV
jgi:hypothetical protein